MQKLISNTVAQVFVQAVIDLVRRLVCGCPCAAHHQPFTQAGRRCLQIMILYDVFYHNIDHLVRTIQYCSTCACAHVRPIRVLTLCSVHATQARVGDTARQRVLPVPCTALHRARCVICLCSTGVTGLSLNRLR